MAANAKITKTDLLKILYERHAAYDKFASDAHFQWGKWLLASLLVVHGGALVACMSSEEVGKEILLASGWAFFLGLFSVLCAGAVAWVNWQYVAAQRSAIVFTPEWILDRDSWPEEDVKRHQKWITCTLWVGVVLVIASLVLFFVGGYRAAGELGLLPACLW